MGTDAKVTPRTPQRRTGPPSLARRQRFPLAARLSTRRSDLCRFFGMITTSAEGCYRPRVASIDRGLEVRA